MNIFVPLRTQSVAVAARGGREARRVAPAPRLGERPRREPLAARGLRQILLLLRLGAERQDVAGAEAVVRRDGERERAVDARDLFDADRVARRVHSRAAVLLGDADAEQAELGELRDELLREALFLVPFPRVRCDLAAREIAHGLAQEGVVLGEVEVHVAFNELPRPLLRRHCAMQTFLPPDTAVQW